MRRGIAQKVRSLLELYGLRLTFDRARTSASSVPFDLGSSLLQDQLDRSIMHDRIIVMPL